MVLFVRFSKRKFQHLFRSRTLTNFHDSRDLKTAAHLSRIFPPDPGLTPPTHEIFERFYQTYGQPNDDELILLRRVGYARPEVIEEWCKQALKKRARHRCITDELLVANKRSRLRAFYALKRLRRRFKYRWMKRCFPRRYMVAKAIANIQKPPTRH